MRSRGHRQRGQAVTEYVVIVFFWAALLFTPLVPRPLVQRDLIGPSSESRVSVFMMFIEAFDVYINSFHTVITLPIP